MNGTYFHVAYILTRRLQPAVHSMIMRNALSALTVGKQCLLAKIRKLVPNQCGSIICSQGISITCELCFCIVITRVHICHLPYQPSFSVSDTTFNTRLQPSYDGSTPAAQFLSPYVKRLVIVLCITSDVSRNALLNSDGMRE